MKLNFNNKKCVIERFEGKETTKQKYSVSLISENEEEKEALKVLYQYPELIEILFVSNHQDNKMRIDLEWEEI